MPKYDFPTGQTSLASRIWFSAVGTLAFFALLTAYLGVYTVDQGDIGIVKRNGASIGTADPGLNFKIPYVDTVDEIEIRERAAHLEMTVSSKDPMVLPPVRATVNWSVNKPKIIHMYNEYGSLDQLEKRVILPAFQAGIKAATSQFTVNDLIRDRGKLEEAAGKEVRARVPLDVVNIASVFVVDLDFPKQYTDQILAKQVAAEAVLTEQYTLDKQKLAIQQTVQTAEASRDAQKAAADGKAYEIKVQGDAIAQAIETRGKALATNPLVIDYEKVQRWGGIFPDTFMGGDQAAATLWSLPGKAQEKKQ